MDVHWPYHLEEVLQYAKEMKSLSPALRHSLSDLMIQCEVARILTYRVAWLQDKGLPFGSEAAKVKLYSTELNQRVAEFAMQVTGLYSGLMEGSKWAQLDGCSAWYLLRSVGNTLEAGSSEIDRDIIASQGLQLPRR